MAAERSEGASAPDVAISLDRGCLLRGGREIRLRAKTFQVLTYLLERRGRLVGKEDLLRDVWPDTFVSDDSLTKCIREIRVGLGDHDHQMLKTVARRGFILDAPLNAITQEAPRGQQPREGTSEPPAHNLPPALTSFIGRQREIAELSRLLPATRLLTLTGAGGCGKTRLALELARHLLRGFPDGVWLVDLAPVAEPALVAQTVASVLDVRQAPNRRLVETLSDQLRNRRTLLVLDNCEHLIAASAELVDTLLRAAAQLTVLATSREALAIAGERAWRVPSLTLPGPHDSDLSDDFLQYEAVQLLVERAAAADSRFAVTRANAGTVAEVCRRLDGIPLAIELAAARLKVLSIEQINSRLDDCFRLLARTGRTASGRQRTLEAAVDWSYDLLPDAERQLLRRLSTFAGGWTLEAAEHVCSGNGIDRGEVLDLMSRLVDKSLVLVDEEAEGGRRYRFLETVRQYGSMRLRESGEADRVRAGHFAFFLELARRAEPELTTAGQLQWLDRLQAEHANLRTALEWRLASDHPGPDSLELAVPMHWFWVKRAYLAEGRQWLERALATSAATRAPRHTEALLALGNLTFFQGDFDHAQRLLEESAASGRAEGNLSLVGFALGMLTMVRMELGDREGAGRSAAGSTEAARASGDHWLNVFSLSYYAYEALYAGDIERAGQLHEEALAMCRTRGELWGQGIVLSDLALLRVVQHRLAEARALCGEAIAIGRRFGDRRAIAWCLGMLAGANAAEGHSVSAARLRGAMDGLLASIGVPAQPTYNSWIGDRLFPAVQDRLGAAAYEQALAEGRAMSLSQALEYAMGAGGLD
ncbi:MAG TPA: winged helix-turn-helix domain-containing protein [Vicinamibacterales bacterium]|nr:winged helix-turn-helix domain-containing protein [Vicinamibacterales bacterium]